MQPAVAKPTREYGLDWLRVLAFLLLILYHTGMIFVSWDFHIKNPETSRLLESLMLALNRWRLPLLFFISGCGIWYSLRRRGPWQFLSERTRRLFVPIVLGMLVIVPPQIYFERLTQGLRQSYWQWYPEVYRFQPYPGGSFSWHHLWFIVYIWIFSIVLLPVFFAFKSDAARRTIGVMASVIEKHWFAIYLVNIPSLAVALTLGPHWPTTHNLIADWANLTSCAITLLWGFVFASETRLLDVLTRRRKEFLGGLILCYALTILFRETSLLLGFDVETRRVILTCLSSLFGLFGIFALIGYARQKLNFDHPLLRYLNEAVLPFYIVHQTIMIAIGYYVIQTPWNLWIKFAVVALGTFAGTWLSYEMIRRTALTRFLFGVKSQPVKTAATSEAVSV